MTLRRAGVEEAATLAELNTHVQAWHAEHYPEVFFAKPDVEGLIAWFTERLSDPACTAFLAGDPPVGYALCSFQARAGNVFSPPVRRLIIDHVGVAPMARRQGHGQKLMEAARLLARELCVDEIFLDTWEANTEAHAFFRSQGFSPRRMLFRATP